MIEQKVKEILAENLCSPLEGVTLEALLQNDLSADSLDLVEIVMELEDAFNISIPDTSWVKLENVKDVVDLVTEIIGDV